MKAHRSIIRRFCLALVTVHTLAFAVAPFIDMQALPAGGPQLSVQAARDFDANGVPQHDPSTCVICAIMHDAPWSQAEPRGAHVDRMAGRGMFAMASVATPAAPQPGFLSRAPPAFS